MLSIFARYIKLTTSCPFLGMSRELRQDAVSIFNAGIDAVLPHQMVRNALCVNGNKLYVDNTTYTLNHNVNIVAFGKAVIGMVSAVDSILNDHIVGGVASVPLGITKDLIHANKRELLPRKESKIKIIEGGENNLPDDNSFQAANEINDIACNLKEDDLLVVLISGGGSALLPLPVPPITLAEKHTVCKILAIKGATINEINTVRKNLSLLKGGGLAKAAYPAKVLSLILSDIIDDLLGLIASGPTIVNDSSPKDCLDIIHKFHANNEMPVSVMTYLQSHSDQSPHQQDFSNQLTKNSGDANFKHVQNVLVGTNKIAVQSVVNEAEKLGYQTFVYKTNINGEARDIGKTCAKIAAYVYSIYQSKCTEVNSLKETGLTDNDIAAFEDVTKKAKKAKKPVCIIIAGETTVTVTGKGKGGRNQELALAAAVCMDNIKLFGDMAHNEYQVCLLSGGTDGQDGPTNAAGALAYPGQVIKARESGLDAEQYLKDNDSYHFYSKFNDGKDLLVTGLTGTNVMDIMLLLISPPN